MSTAAIDSTNARKPDGTDKDRKPTAVDVGCRVLDVIVAAVLLVVSSPLMLLVAVAIRLESPGPALFRQRRVGRSLVPFTVNKFPHDAAGRKP